MCSSDLGLAGLFDLRIHGDLLTSVNAATLAFLGLAAGSAGGVQLPQDALGSVAVRDLMPQGSIRAKSVQSVAFGQYVNASSVVSPSTAATSTDALRMLAAGTATVLANDTFKVVFGDTYAVAMFLGLAGAGFDTKPIVFRDQGADNVAVLGTVGVKSGSPTQITSVALSGDGGSIQTSQWVYSITSTGWLGDLTLGSNKGLNDVTAPSMAGQIDVAAGSISGDVQTTGIRIDPISGAATSVSADIGKLSASNVMTKVHVFGSLTGRVISRGNLLSQVIVDGGVSGVIAAQGNVGLSISNPTGLPTRHGGIQVAGTLSGQVVALGDVIGDVSVKGGLKGGRIGIKGSILGATTIGTTFDAASVVVAGGSIGGADCKISVPTVSGIIAAKGSISFLATPVLNGGRIYNLATGANATAISSIFTAGGVMLAFDGAKQDLSGLGQILSDLKNLKANASGVLTGPVA